MLVEFDSLVKQRSELKAWWALGSTYAAYDRKNHQLHIVTQKPSTISFCGQQYSGARNYHDAPISFLDAVKNEMSLNAKAVVANAYEKEIARLDGLIEKHKAAVLLALEESNKQS